MSSSWPAGICAQLIRRSPQFVLSFLLQSPQEPRVVVEEDGPLPSFSPWRNPISGAGHPSHGSRWMKEQPVLPVRHRLSPRPNRLRIVCWDIGHCAQPRDREIRHDPIDTKVSTLKLERPYVFHTSCGLLYWRQRSSSSLSVHSR